MAVEHYIHDLLYRYECVILPEFGAFITQHHSALLNEAKGLFQPPRKTISFNRQLTRNDGLLAHHMVQVEQISYEKAIQKLKEYVQDLNAAIHEAGHLSLGNIGTFSIREGEKIQFEPSQASNYLLDSFGLQSVKAEEVYREPEEDENDIDFETEPIPLFPEEEEKSKPWLKYAAIGVVTMGITGALGMNAYHYRIEQHNLSEQQKAYNQLELQIQKATFVIQNPLPTITLNIKARPGKYHIVAGAFRLEANARKKVEQLNAEGFSAREIGKNKYGLYQVVFSSHKSRLKALRELYRLRSTYNPSAWLLVQEL